MPKMKNSILYRVIIYQNNSNEGRVFKTYKDDKNAALNAMDLATELLSFMNIDAYVEVEHEKQFKGFNELFDKYDLVLIPTIPSAAFKIGEKIDNPLEMYLADICTVSVNIIGSPAMNVPCALDSNGVPIGFQLIAKAFNEKAIFQAAYTYEQNYKFSEKPTFRKGDKNA